MKSLVSFVLCLLFAGSAYGQSTYQVVPTPLGTPINGAAGQPGAAAVLKDGTQLFMAAPGPGGTPGSIPVVPGGAPTPAQWVGLAVPAATVPSAYTPNAVGTTSVTALTNANRLRFCRFRNGTNQPVSVSSDGTNDNLPAVSLASTEWVDFAADGRDVRTSLVIKYTSAAPTTGSFYINCFY